MSMPLISVADLVIAEGHPRFPEDIKNRAGKYIQDQIEVEHDSDGMHTERGYAIKGETGSFTGNGANNRVIFLDAETITPQFVEVWRSGDFTTELVTNGGFDSDTTGWTASSGASIASIAGGESGNCCELTFTATPPATTGTRYITQAETVTAGKRYLLTYYYKSGTAGTVNFFAGILGSTVATGVSSGTWQQQSMEITPASASITIAIGVSNAPDGTTLIDTVSLKQAPLYQPFYSPAGCFKRFSDCRTSTAISSVNGHDSNNLVINAGFDIDVSGWTASSGATASSVSGGQAGNCCQLSLAGTSARSITQNVSVTSGYGYKLNFYIKSGTAGNISFFGGISGVTAYQTSGTTSGTWAQHSVNIPASASTVALEIGASGASGTVLIDSVVLQQVAAFAVNATDDVNFNALTNYYFVLGNDTATTYTRDAGGTDPDWVEDGESGLGGAVGTEVANKVENHIETQFLMAHSDAGVHTTDPYSTTPKIEFGSVLSTGASQTVTLTNTAMVVYFAMAWVAGSLSWITSDDMDTGDAKREGTAAFVTGIIDDLGIGSFDFTGTNGTTYQYMVTGI